MPMPEDGGRDLALVRNPLTGRFDWDWDDTGNPAFSDDESHMVLSLLLEKQGRYWADKTGKRGSLLHTVKQDVAATAATLGGYSNDALQPAVDDGRIENVAADATRLGPGRYTLNIDYSDQNGHQQNRQIPFAG